jgi:hypothetical protein
MPCPNSTGAPLFKLILAASVEPSAIVPTSAPMPRINLKGFFDPWREGPDGAKLSRDMGTRLEDSGKLLKQTKGRPKAKFSQSV